MDLGLYVVLSLCTGVAVLGALARGWSLHSRLYSLEDRINVIEGTVTREVKIRAAAERWKKPAEEDSKILEALKTPAQPTASVPWWKNPNLKRGAYVPGKANG